MCVHCIVMHALHLLFVQMKYKKYKRTYISPRKYIFTRTLNIGSPRDDQIESLRDMLIVKRSFHELDLPRYHHARKATIRSKLE